MSAGDAVLRAHVERFNAGVRTGDFTAMAAALSSDAVMTFHGPPVGPFTGRDAIAAAYAQHPPDDEIVVLSTRRAGETVCAEYAWAGAPATPSGTLCLTLRGDTIATVEISFHAT